MGNEYPEKNAIEATQNSHNKDNKKCDKIVTNKGNKKR